MTGVCTCRDVFENLLPMSEEEKGNLCRWISEGKCQCVTGEQVALDAVTTTTLYLIHILAAFNHLTLLRNLVETGCDANKPTQPRCQTALQIVTGSSVRAPIELIECLVLAGADVNMQDLYGDTSLHMAAERGYDDILKVLVESGAKLDVCNDDDETPLYIATAYGHLCCVRVLVEAGANVNTCKESGWSAITIAVRYSRTEVVRILLQGKCDVNLSSTGCSDNALHYAAYQGIHKFYLY